MTGGGKVSLKMRPRVPKNLEVRLSAGQRLLMINTNAIITHAQELSASIPVQALLWYKRSTDDSEAHSLSVTGQWIVDTTACIFTQAHANLWTTLPELLRRAVRLFLPGSTLSARAHVMSWFGKAKKPDMKEAVR